ncbi:flagellar hook-length control protein FliK [Sphingobium lactosutens]|uniref:flagellar hook-length control protein FliK n=1 Tax=Sphingobium lactosutens TaxID=522773 RepID=UPI00040D8B32|nr:flagellar hook-length control protein FliK [Sphingobium lactosutens]
MTMLTSLKALLFPTAVSGGATPMALPAEGGADFAQFLGAAQSVTPVTGPAQSAMPAKAPAAGEGAAVAPPASPASTAAVPDAVVAADRAPVRAGATALTDQATPAPQAQVEDAAEIAAKATGPNPLPEVEAVEMPNAVLPTPNRPTETLSPSKQPNVAPQTVAAPTPDATPTAVANITASPVIASPVVAKPANEPADQLPVPNDDALSPSAVVGAPSDKAQTVSPLATPTEVAPMTPVASPASDIVLRGPDNQNVARPARRGAVESPQTPVAPSEVSDDEPIAQPATPDTRAPTDQAPDMMMPTPAMAILTPAPLPLAPAAVSTPISAAPAPVVERGTPSQPAMSAQPRAAQAGGKPVDAEGDTSISPLTPPPVATSADIVVPRVDVSKPYTHAPVAPSPMPVEEKAVPVPPATSLPVEPQLAATQTAVDGVARANLAEASPPLRQSEKAAQLSVSLSDATPDQDSQNMPASASMPVADAMPPADPSRPAVASRSVRTEPVALASTTSTPGPVMPADDLGTETMPPIAVAAPPIARPGNSVDRNAALALANADPVAQVTAPCAAAATISAAASAAPAATIVSTEAPTAPAAVVKPPVASTPSVDQSAPARPLPQAAPDALAAEADAIPPSPVAVPREAAGGRASVETPTPETDGALAAPANRATIQPVASQAAVVPPAIDIAEPVVAQPDRPSDAARPMVQRVRAEAVSLLQLVRDQMTGRAAPPVEARGDNQRTTANDTAPVVAASPTAAAPPASAATAPLLAPAPQTVAPLAPIATPAIDLSASLGAQMVDMGVSGQWIDGLARDIAGLSANGAQGRFQINADQLGPVQVDIRQGADGAAVSLTVASEAAELALRQDSDQLKRDPAFSGARIHDVRVERAAHITEPARADGTSNHNGSSSDQQQPSSANQWQAQGQGSGQGSGQGAAQSQMQGRQGRENIAQLHKNGDASVVMDSEEAGNSARDTVRARYA